MPSRGSPVKSFRAKWSNWPPEIAEYLQALILELRSPAFLVCDPERRLIARGGDLSRYGLQNLREEEAVTDHAYFLEGLVPLNGSKAVLSQIETATGTFADIHLFPVRGGDCILLLDSTREVAERAKIEQSLRHAEERLRQAERMEALGRLAGGVAHDFNNLLTVINGYSIMLADQLRRDDSRWAYANEIRKMGDRAASLTKQLLSFSRTQIIKPKKLDLNSIIVEAERMLRRLIGDDIKLFTKLDPALGQIMADPEQLHQVIMNLVVNAGDAMADGGNLLIKTTNLEVSEGAGVIRDEAKPGPYVMMSVTDTGGGMSEETLQHIFEPFFTTKERGKGTGLGLSTVYGIVRQSGGWIEVGSELGVGTSFKLYFPRIEGAPVEARSETPGLPVEQGDETVLIVEDQDAVLRYVKAILEAYGYHVIEASNGDEAMAVAKAFPGEIDLLLTDVVLPGMNGKILAERLKGNRKNLKVLFMSGYPSDVIAHRGVLESGVAYIPKPFSPDGLAAKIREVLTGASAAR
jgi:two-component system cell cycle sensor histidine kinase/response regulator CckA